MNLNNATLIQSVTPARYASNVALNPTIQVKFVYDLDVSTLSDSTVILEKVNASGRLETTLSYSSRILTITPSEIFEPNITYRITLAGDNIIGDSTVSGLKDILGNGMRGNYMWSFTTTSTSVLPAPTIVSPENQTATISQPTFTWTAVTSADHYEIQVALNNTFESLYWPLEDDLYDSNGVSIIPDRAFNDSREYWWRVRAVDAGGQVGVWSPTHNFYKGDPNLGLVSPEDVPVADFITTSTTTVEIYSVLPAANTVSIATSGVPYIEVKVTGQPDLDGITTTTFTVTGFPVNMDEPSSPAIPFWVPSTNTTYSGGVAAPTIVDEYLKIEASGMLEGATLEKSYDAVNDITTIRLIPSDASYFLRNNRYICTLDISEISRKWQFVTTLWPFFSTVKYVRSHLRSFASGYTDEEISFMIWDHSLLAMYLGKFPPGYEDGSSWLYTSDASFNIQEPPYFVKQFVRHKTAYEMLRSVYLEVVSGGGRVKLGELEYEKGDLVSEMKDVMKENLKQLTFWENKLMGLTRHGVAGPKIAVRGGWREGMTEMGFLFHNRSNIGR